MDNSTDNSQSKGAMHLVAFYDGSIIELTDSERRQFNRCVLVMFLICLSAVPALYALSR